MKHTYYLLFCLISFTFFTACKKDPAFSAGTTGGNTNIPSCLVTEDSSDQNTNNSNQFIISYDANGQATKVMSLLSGSASGSVDITPTKIVRTEADGTSTFDFVKNIFTGQPTSYTFSSTNAAYASRSAKLTYNGNGKPTKVEQYGADNTLQNTIDLTYDSKDNLMVISIGSGSNKTTYTATSYGEKNGPFSAVPGAALLFYSWDYASVQYTDLFFRLSSHNILSWNLTYATGSTTATYTYNSFNTQNFPTDIVASVASTDNGATSFSDAEYTYTYDCK